MFHSFLPPNITGGISFLKFGQGVGFMKKLLRNRGLVEREGGGSLRKGVSKLFHQFSIRKAGFRYYWNFCLVTIPACCNQ